MELLAPGGDIDAAKAAIVAGANAIYCGLNKFNARNRAENIQFDDLVGLIRLAHEHDCQVFLTLNILILDAEIPELFGLLNKLANTQLDGLIVQDLGLLYLLKKYFPSLNVHASTQLTTHNIGQIQFLSRLNVSRVNLSRELNIEEIKSLSSFAHQNNVLTEVFVHGSYCISFSGICYMSSLQNGKSGNRGMCSQPCRDRYESTKAGKEFPLNLKDNSAFFDVEALYNAGVSSLKIEGRIKEFYYVHTVVNAWRKQLNRFYNKQSLLNDNGDLYKVFNRDFSNGFLKGNINKDMFIDSPMSYSSIHHSKINAHVSTKTIAEGHQALYAEKDLGKIEIKNKIDAFSTLKLPVQIAISGKAGLPITMTVKTQDKSFTVTSDVLLANEGNEVLTPDMILKRLKAIDDTEYQIAELNMDAVEGEVYIPFSTLTALKKKILFRLNGNKETIAPISRPKIKTHKDDALTPKLSILISSTDDLPLCENTTASVYYQLPNDVHNQLDGLVGIFTQNPQIQPWFPSILIGEDYGAAISFLEQVKPAKIVSNNTGIGFEACKKGISWIAGPYLNAVNSYTLLCLKEYFNCAGAFISNEINEIQIRQIKKPENFELHYNMYHPVVLMTSRQCLLHPVSACEKHKIDHTCIRDCNKASTITNLKGETFFIKKEKGNYHKLYNEHNYLNTDIANSFPNRFSSYCIDLREIKTSTSTQVNKLMLINQFQEYIALKEGAGKTLHTIISPTTNKQYITGI